MQTSLEHWLTEHCKLAPYQLDPLPSDASFRRYFRVRHQDQTYIAMDASAEKQSCIPFVAIATSLRLHGLHAPHIFNSDFSSGFLLLTDFGDRLLLKELNQTNARMHYHHALNALQKMQRCQVSGWTLKPFTQEFMRNELSLFQEWFFEKHLALTLTDATNKMLATPFDFLAEHAALQPTVFMHRDYHSQNLMILPDNQLGILDFQDAFIGPHSYDLVSLLRDCYIDWPEEFVQDCVRYFWKNMPLPKMSLEAFLRDFDLMGMQRHLKALLTFSRKYQRDHNAHYLQFIPRTLNYILSISQRYQETKALHRFLMNEVRPICVA